MRNMLQRGRIVLSWLLMGAMVLTFAGIVAPVLPQWQVLPALLAGNLLVIAVIIVLTLLLGRIYCSVLCPLGISQDFVFWLAKRRKKNRRKFTFRRERRIVRYSILMLTGLAFLAGLSGFVGLVDPYSIFGRIVHDGLGPASCLWLERFGRGQRKPRLDSGAEQDGYPLAAAGCHGPGRGLFRRPDCPGLALWPSVLPYCLPCRHAVGNPQPLQPVPAGHRRIALHPLRGL